MHIAKQSSLFLCHLLVSQLCCRSLFHVRESCRLYHSMTQLLAIFDTKIEKNAIKMNFFIGFSTFSIAF